MRARSGVGGVLNKRFFFPQRKGKGREKLLFSCPVPTTNEVDERKSDEGKELLASAFHLH